MGDWVEPYMLWTFVLPPAAWTLLGVSFVSLIQRRGRARWSLVVLGLFFGVACTLALMHLLPPPAGEPSTVQVRVFAPIREELFKFIALLLVFALLRGRDEVEGWVAGAFVGLGFMLLENQQKLDDATEAAHLWALLRAYGFAPLHVVTTSVCGFALGFARARPGVRSIAAIAAAFLGAVLFHGGYNSLDLQLGGWSTTLGALPVLLALTGLGWVVWRRVRDVDAKPASLRTALLVTFYSGVVGVGIPIFHQVAPYPTLSGAGFDQVLGAAITARHRACDRTQAARGVTSKGQLLSDPCVLQFGSFGEEHRFEIVGSTESVEAVEGSNPFRWATPLATAAVFLGCVKDGEEAVIRATLVEIPAFDRDAVRDGGMKPADLFKTQNGVETMPIYNDEPVRGFRLDCAPPGVSVDEIIQ